MLLHRGYEEAEDIINSVNKEAPNFYISGSQYHNIGYKFEQHLRPDIKEIEDRFMMSYCFENSNEKKKTYVIFGTNNKSFIEILSDIILDALNKDFDYDLSFCVVLNKPFNIKYSSRLDEMALKINLRLHLDSSLVKPPFHSLGSRYSLMTEGEVNKFLDECKLTKRQLPKIGVNDPMMMYYDYPRGSVIRCHRTPNITGSMISGELPPYYKIVV